MKKMNIKKTHRKRCVFLMLLFHKHFEEVVADCCEAGACQINAEVEVECHFLEAEEYQYGRQEEQHRNRNVFDHSLQIDTHFPDIKSPTV